MLARLAAAPAVLAVLSFVGAAAFAPPAAAQKKASWVALVRVREAPPAWAEALRATAEAEGKDRPWVPPPAVSISDAQLALGCSDFNDECAGQIASMTGAVYALVVDVDGSGKGATVRAFTVKAGDKGGAPTALELPGKGPVELDAAKELVKAVVKGDAFAFLSVDTDVPGVEVWLGNEKVGTTPWHGRVAPGEHTLVLRQEGRAPLTRALSLQAGSFTRESHSLGAAGAVVEVNPVVAPDRPPHEVRVPTEQPPDVAGAPGNAAVGYALAGVGGALGLAGAAFFGATVYDLNRRVDCARPEGCVPNEALLFGIYPRPERHKLFDAQTAWITGSIAAVGMGGLLVGTGLVLATGAPEQAPE